MKPAQTNKNNRQKMKTIPIIKRINISDLVTRINETSMQSIPP